MKYLKLAGAKNLYLKLDDEDYENLKHIKWYVLSVKNTWYAYMFSSKEYTHLYGYRKKVYIHKILTNTVGLSDKLADHIDGNGLNNCRINLRVVNFQQNLWNRRKSNKPGLTSKFIGVSKFENRWRSVIRSSEGKHIHIGLFDNENDAAYAYNLKAIELRGEYAVLNIIPCQ